MYFFSLKIVQDLVCIHTSLHFYLKYLSLRNGIISLRCGIIWIFKMIDDGTIHPPYQTTRISVEKYGKEKGKKLKSDHNIYPLNQSR